MSNNPPPPPSTPPPNIPSRIGTNGSSNNLSLQDSLALRKLNYIKRVTAPPPPIAPPPAIQHKNTSNGSSSKPSLQEALALRKIKKQPIQLADLPIGITEQDKLTKRKLRIVIMSDTHMHHNSKIVPDGDIFLHCGDMTDYGDMDEFSSFNEFLGKLPHKDKIVICGNHESGVFHISKSLDADEIKSKVFSNATAYLQDSYVIVEGLKIYGSPWVKNMTYMERWMVENRHFYQSEEFLAQKYSKIDADTDILLTHIPPFKILDGDVHGSTALREVIDKKLIQSAGGKLKLSCFGHVHPMFGKQVKGEALFVNAAMDNDEECVFVDYYI